MSPFGRAIDFLVVRLFVFIALTASAALARNITTRTGETFYNVAVNRIEPTGISITHSTGVAFLECPVLTAELQHEFGCTPEGYAAGKLQREQQEKALAEYQQRMAVEAAARNQQANLEIAAAMDTAARRNGAEGSIQNRDYDTRIFSDDRYSRRSYPGTEVYVQGYYRKDGTYVHSYTRSAPRR